MTTTMTTILIGLIIANILIETIYFAICKPTSSEENPTNQDYTYMFPPLVEAGTTEIIMTKEEKKELDKYHRRIGRLDPVKTERFNKAAHLLGRVIDVAMANRMLDYIEKNEEV